MNLIDATVDVYREPHFTGYGRKSVWRAGQTVAPLTFPDAALDVAELLKR